MTPDQLSKSGTEHGHQVAFFAYVAVATNHGFEVADAWAATGDQYLSARGFESKPLPQLKWIHAIHNQGHGDVIRGGKAKAEGVRAGVWDIFVPITNKYAGLYIEMKKPSMKPKTANSKGGVSEDQKEFGYYASSVGYYCAVCYSWQEAVKVLKHYLHVVPDEF